MILTNFEQTVLTLVRRIPAGRVSTYALVARALGRPEAARAVGNALHRNPQLVTTPCHRVVRSDGQIGGYRQGSSRKRALLEQEGVTVNRHQSVANFEQALYRFS
ncbi:MAG: hypothetical protein A3J59_04310 [Candidatus Buchananbacteria bacterium RIFCSPHIGHO2_02_FULL_56_16]|uniref:methylated-DNA--[protein]-cysteine S-methyltransferase n=1 Tax=Candidatus Buchananbacteria bacterium RIFCSPHIGHO2_02_FULL_56_16 TaxID=1797542 RepID=A0A1G1YJK7_9BACT|nr:MAG: hypothetical protein A3J59_04310 [Candidatus Buchananbacteria bacterium RIFCSPHIGHO2_02_FULL_56_16]